MTIEVYVVTSIQVGWDCVVAVLDQNDISMEEAIKKFPENEGYIITEQTVVTDITNIN